MGLGLDPLNPGQPNQTARPGPLGPDHWPGPPARTTGPDCAGQPQLVCNPQLARPRTMTAPAHSSYVDRLNTQGALPWLKGDATVLGAKIYVCMSDFDNNALGPLASAFTSNDPLNVVQALSPTFVSETFEHFGGPRAVELLSLDLRSVAQLAFVNIDQLCDDLDYHFQRMQQSLERALGLARYGVTILRRLLEDDDLVLKFFATRALHDRGVNDGKPAEEYFSCSSLCVALMEVARAAQQSERFDAICDKVRKVLCYHADHLREFEGRVGHNSLVRSEFDACKVCMVKIRTELATLWLLRRIHVSRTSHAFDAICDMRDEVAAPPPLNGCVPSAQDHAAPLLQAIFERVMCAHLARAIQCTCMALHSSGAERLLSYLDPMNPLYGDLARTLLPTQAGVAAQMATLRGVCMTFARHSYLHHFKPRAVPLGALESRWASGMGLTLAETLATGGLVVKYHQDPAARGPRQRQFEQKLMGSGWQPEPGSDSESNFHLDSREAKMKAGTTTKLPYVTLYAPFMKREPLATATRLRADSSPPEVQELLRHFSQEKLKELGLWDWAHGDLALRRTGEDGRAYDESCDTELGNFYNFAPRPQEALPRNALDHSRLLARPDGGTFAPPFPCDVFRGTLACDGHLVPDVELACSLYQSFDESDRRLLPGASYPAWRVFKDYRNVMQPMVDRLNDAPMDRSHVFTGAAGSRAQERVFKGCFNERHGFPNISLERATTTLGAICNTLRYVTTREKNKIPDDPNARAQSFCVRRVACLRSISDSAKLEAGVGPSHPHTARSLAICQKNIEWLASEDKTDAYRTLFRVCWTLGDCLLTAARSTCKIPPLPDALLHSHGVMRATAIHRAIEPRFYACNFQRVTLRREECLVQSLCDLSSVLGGSTSVGNMRLKLGSVGGLVALRMSVASSAASRAVASLNESRAVQAALQTPAGAENAEDAEDAEDAGDAGDAGDAEDPQPASAAVSSIARTGCRRNRNLESGLAVYMRRVPGAALERAGLELPPKRPRDGLLCVALCSRPVDRRGPFNPFGAAEALVVSQRFLCERKRPRV